MWNDNFFPNEQIDELADCSRYIKCNHQDPKTESFKRHIL